MIRRLFTLVPLLHLYVGLRLLPDLSPGAGGLAAGILILLVLGAPAEISKLYPLVARLKSLV